MDNLSLIELLEKLRTDKDLSDQLDQSKAVQAILELLKTTVAGNNIEAKDLAVIKASISNFARMYGVETKKFFTALNAFTKEVKDALTTGSVINKKELAVAVAQEMTNLTAVSQSLEAKGKDPIFRLNGSTKSQQFKALFGQPLTKEDLQNSLDKVSDKIISFFTSHDQQKDAKDRKKQSKFISELLEGLTNSKFVGGAMRDSVRLLGMVMGTQVRKFFAKHFPNHPVAGNVAAASTYVLSSVVAGLPSLLTGIANLVLSIKGVGMLFKGIGTALSWMKGLGGGVSRIDGAVAKIPLWGNMIGMFKGSPTAPVGLTGLNKVSNASKVVASSNIVQGPWLKAAATGAEAAEVGGAAAKTAEVAQSAGLLSKATPFLGTAGKVLGKVAAPLGVAAEGFSAYNSWKQGNKGAVALHGLSAALTAGAGVTAATGVGAPVAVGLGLAALGTGLLASHLDKKDKEKKEGIYSNSGYLDMTTTNKILLGIHRVLTDIAGSVKTLAEGSLLDLSIGAGGAGTVAREGQMTSTTIPELGASIKTTTSPHKLTGTMSSHGSPYANVFDLTAPPTSVVSKSDFERAVKQFFPGASVSYEGDHYHIVQSTKGLIPLQGEAGYQPKGSTNAETARLRAGVLFQHKDTEAKFDPTTGAIMNASVMERSKLYSAMTAHLQTAQGQSLYEFIDPSVMQEGAFVNDIPVIRKGTSSSVKGLQNFLKSQYGATTKVSSGLASYGSLSSDQSSIEIKNKVEQNLEDTSKLSSPNQAYNDLGIEANKSWMNQNQQAIPSVSAKPLIVDPTGNGEISERLSYSEKSALSYMFG